MVPAILVDGVGAVALPVPPAELVYQSRPVPPAVRAELLPPIHRFTGELTVGAAGVALMVTTIFVRGPSHLEVFLALT